MLLKLAIAIALAHSLSPQLFTAIIMQESSFKNGQISATGDLGLGQLAPRTGASVGCVDTQKLQWDARYNLNCAAQYLQYLKGKFGAERNWWTHYNSNHPMARARYEYKVIKRMNSSIQTDRIINIQSRGTK